MAARLLVTGRDGEGERARRRLGVTDSRLLKRCRRVVEQSWVRQQKTKLTRNKGVNELVARVSSNRRNFANQIKRKPRVPGDTKYDVSMFAHYEDMKGSENANIEVVWGLGVTQCHRKHRDMIDHI